MNCKELMIMFTNVHKLFTFNQKLKRINFS
nr:MAG TPA: hypothetical protein [Caudoviricetes sp.]